MRSGLGRLLACGVTTALLTGATSGCGGQATDGAPSATPSASASAPWTVASTDVPGQPYTIPPDGPPIVHKAGTVPSAVASALAKDDASGPRAAIAPKIERIAAQPGKRKAPVGLDSASMLDDGHVALHSPGRIEIVDLATFSSVALTTGSRIFASSGNATKLVTADVSRRIVVWSLGDKDEAKHFPLPPTKESSDDDSLVAIAPDGARIAFAAPDGIYVWDDAGKETLRIPRETRSYQLELSRDRVSTSNTSSATESFLLEGGKPAGASGYQTGGTFGVAISPDGRWGAGSAPDGHGMQVADLRVPGVRQLVTSDDCNHHVSTSFSRDSRRVYAHLGQDRIKGFDVDTWKPYASYSAPPGRIIASMSDDLGRVTTTNAEGLDPRVVVVAGQKETPLERPFEGPASYGMSDDGLTVIGNDDKHEVRVWSARTGKLVYEVTPG